MNACISELYSSSIRRASFVCACLQGLRRPGSESINACLLFFFFGLNTLLKTLPDTRVPIFLHQNLPLNTLADSQPSDHFSSDSRSDGKIKVKHRNCRYVYYYSNFNARVNRNQLYHRHNNIT